MTKCTDSGCRNLEWKCADCGRIASTATIAKIPGFGEWISFQKIVYSPFSEFYAPYDGKPFLACIWGNDSGGSWVGQAIYARHYDANNRIPGKYEFFYVTKNPEEEGWMIDITIDPFPITHWMPLPPIPEEK